MADVLHQLERGNVSALAGMFDVLGNAPDALHVIQCADSYRRNNLTTIEEFKSYVEYTVSKSKYIGDIYPIYLETILCRSFRPQLPNSLVAQGKQLSFCLSLSFCRFSAFSKLHLRKR